MSSPENIRLCPVCGSKVVGRSDKQYCSDRCRTLKHNESRSEHDQVVFDTNKQLRLNRSILKKLCPVGRSVVRKEVLDSMNYRSDLFTSMFMTENKEVYYLCYDYGFMPLIERNILKALIISRQSYMKPWNPWRFAKKPSPKKDD